MNNVNKQYLAFEETFVKAKCTYAFYRAFFEFSLEAVFLTAPDGTIFAANPAACQLFGHTEEEICLLGRSGLVDSSSPQLGQILAKRSSVGRARGELIYKRKDGTRFPGTFSSNQYTDEDGKVRTILIVRDLTQQRQEEQKLLDSEEKYRSVVSAMAEGVVFQSADGLILAVNLAAERIMGATMQDLIGRTSADPKWESVHEDGTIFPGKDHPSIVTLRTGKPQSDVVMGIKIPDGTRRWISINSAPVIAKGDSKPTAVVTTFHDITDRKRQEAALAESEARFRGAFETAAHGMALLSLDGKFLKVNHALCAMIGYDISELLARDFQTITHPEDLSADLNYLHQLLDGQIESYQMEKRYFHKNGNIVWVLLSVSLVRTTEGVPIHFVSHILNNTERKQIETELRISSVAFESQQSMMITDPNGVILRVNKAFMESTGYSSEEAVSKKPSMLTSGHHDEVFYCSMWETILRTGSWQGEIWDRRKNGEVYPQWLTISAVNDSEGTVTHYVGSHLDITERKLAEDQIKHLAFYDQLTLLPNRRLLLDRLNQALASCGRSGRNGAVIFIDLDNFKSLNDTLGHNIGDLLLQQVAKRMESCVREGDTVARLGGDEFVVLLEDLSKESLEAAAQAEGIGEKILLALNQSYCLGTHERHNTPSLGITLFNENKLNPEELFKQADLAMYQAKKAGRNTMRFFDPQMQESINARSLIEAELLKALENHQFHLYYQIQVDSLRRPTGAEALIRWIHPERGMVSPSQFIPIAEESLLIVSIGGWVLETACTQLKEWKKSELSRDLVLSVNVSAKQFHQVNFVDEVKAAVERHDINPQQLKLELTESMLLEKIEETIAIMNTLKAIGVRISLDDFGTGYSSLQYLKRLPINQLKIDQSFVRDLAVDENDKAIAQTIIAMAHSLNLSVIAEGVETEVQQKILLSKGCSHYQGYLFGKPVPIEQFEALLTNSSNGYSVTAPS